MGCAKYNTIEKKCKERRRDKCKTTENREE